MAQPKIVVCSTTLSRDPDEVRAKLAVETAAEVAHCGYPYVVVDGGSAAAFTEALRGTGAYVNDEYLPAGVTRQPIGVGRRQAMNYAHDLAGPDGIVVWMEPEKRTFPSEIHKVVEPIISGAADLVVPTREPGLFRHGYPTEQWHAEEYGNCMFYLYTGLPLDMWGGPRAMNARALAHFTSYEPGDYGDMWDSIFIPVMRAHANGVRVAPVMVSYHHPEEQKKAEEGNVVFAGKRLVQLNNLVPMIEREAKRLGIVGPYKERPVSASSI